MATQVPIRAKSFCRETPPPALHPPVSARNKNGLRRGRRNNRIHILESWRTESHVPCKSNNLAARAHGLCRHHSEWDTRRDYPVSSELHMLEREVSTIWRRAASLELNLLSVPHRRPCAEGLVVIRSGSWLTVPLAAIQGVRNADGISSPVPRRLAFCSRNVRSQSDRFVEKRAAKSRGETTHPSTGTRWIIPVSSGTGGLPAHKERHHILVQRRSASADSGGNCGCGIVSRPAGVTSSKAATLA